MSAPSPTPSKGAMLAAKRISDWMQACVEMHISRVPEDYELAPLIEECTHTKELEDMVREFISVSCELYDMEMDPVGSKLIQSAEQLLAKIPETK